MSYASIQFTDELDTQITNKRDEVFTLLFTPPKTNTAHDIAMLHELYSHADECLSYYMVLCKQLVTCQAIIKQAIDKVKTKPTPATPTAKACDFSPSDTKQGNHTSHTAKTPRNGLFGENKDQSTIDRQSQLCQPCNRASHASHATADGLFRG